ncbi:MAG: molecular chaperone DnaJ [Alphaproteobacteria bacterium]|nr:molecular chaperone DnaJ [Alphaproteobacteria bacterium]
MPWLILAVCVLVGLWLLARWYASAQPADILRAIRWVAATVLVVGLAAIALSGRWNLLWALAFPAFPLLMRWRALRSMRRNASGPSAGQTSQVETRFLRMTLDHDTGDMDGEVREGTHAGRKLSDLKLGEAIELWREVAQADEQSRIVLESFLDRAHPEWRDVVGEAASASREGGSAGDSPWARTDMGVEEARQILGVEADASDADIEAAWRREMKRAHPDQGGSDWMAAKVNQAKDVLLGR